MVLLLVAILMLPVTLLLHGFVLFQLWAWFIVPTFSVAQISMIQALGLSLFVSFMTHQDMPEGKKETDYSRIVRGISYSLAKPALALTIGWVLHFWV